MLDFALYAACGARTRVHNSKLKSASQIAVAGKMVYRIIKGTDAAAAHYSQLSSEPCDKNFL